MRVKCLTHGVEYDEGGFCVLCAAGIRNAYPSEPVLTERVGGLPEGAAERKAIPLYSGLIRYFPDALIEVARLSMIGNEQHNPGKPLHWDRSKSGDELDAMLRHAWEAGTIDSDGVRHSTKTAWRALANLQKELEKAYAAASDN